jgi:predicted nucleotidyltransferase
MARGGDRGAELTTPTDQLRTLAQQAADGLPADIEEVLLTGSVSRGVADEDSDVELLLVGEVLPPVTEIAAGLDVLDVDPMPDGRGCRIVAASAGESLELIAWTRARTEERLDGILAAEIVDHIRIRTAEAVANGVALRSAGRIAAWQRRLAFYPEPLARAIVVDAVGAWIETTPRTVRAQLRAGGRVELAKLVIDDLEDVLRIVFALNRAWEPDWKRLPDRIAPLAVKPEHLAERIEAALREWDVVAVRTLVRDTLSLAPELPQVVRARELTEAILRDLG